MTAHIHFISNMKHGDIFISGENVAINYRVKQNKMVLLIMYKKAFLGGGWGVNNEVFRLRRDCSKKKTDKPQQHVPSSYRFVKLISARISGEDGAWGMEVTVATLLEE